MQKMGLTVRRPMVWLALASAMGMLAGSYIPFSRWMLVAATVAMLALGVLAVWARRAIWVGLLACCVVLGIGWSSRCYTPPSLPEVGALRITGRVDELPRVKQGSASVILSDVTAVREDGQSIALPGTLWLRYQPENEGLLQNMPDLGQIVTANASVYVPGVVRNPGGFDFRAYLMQRGAYLAASVYDPWEISGQPKLGFLPWTQRTRVALSARMDTAYRDLAPLVRGIVLGDRVDLSVEEQQAFRRSGLSHLLSVSGLHVGFVAGTLMWLLAKLKTGSFLRVAILAVALAAYCLLTGAPDSMIRASVMMLVLQAAILARRPYDTLSAIAAVFWVMLLADPFNLRDAGFMLSFGAVTGIALLQKPIAWLLKFLPKFLRDTLSLTLAATIGTMPLVAVYFGELQLMGLVTNLVAVPLTGFITILGLLAMLLDVVCTSVAYPLQIGIYWLAALLQRISRLGASIPFATLRVPSPTGYAVAGCFVAMALVSRYVRGKLWIRASVACAVLLAVFGVSYVTHWHGDQYAQIDVGQGDAAVLRAGGQVIVIDTGSESTSGLIDYLRHEGLTIDTLILSHPHEDHCGALLDLLAIGMPIGRILMPENVPMDEYDVQAGYALLMAQQRGIPILGMDAGTSEQWGNGYEMRVLSPSAQATFSDGNDYSLVVRFTVSGVHILTTGDVTSQAEPLEGTQCDVLKVAHHGSKGSTDTAFLRFAQPAWAVISVGAHNVYGHPAPETLARLVDSGAEVLRTDQGGCITFRLQDGHVTAHPYLREDAP